MRTRPHSENENETEPELTPRAALRLAWAGMKGAVGVSGAESGRFIGQGLANQMDWEPG
jgi:NhaP-type Na+/H+ or K+/H+ antiporter